VNIRNITILLLIPFIQYSLAEEMKAQTAFKTNLAIPLAHLVDSKNFGGGFNFGIDTRVLYNSALRITAHRSKIIFSNPELDFDAVSSSDRYEEFLKDGLRLGFKQYNNKDDERFVFIGEYVGFYTDVMYARRKEVMYKFKQGVGISDEKTLDKKGVFLAGGLSFGYTFNFNNFIIESNMGIGAAFNAKKFLVDNPTGLYFRQFDLWLIHSTTWHFELHVGYVFE
jgi:hypothetical protein